MAIVAGRLLTAEQGGGLDGTKFRGAPSALMADRLSAGPWEEIVVEDNGDGTISLRCPNGMFVCAESGGGGVISTNRTAKGPWERFDTRTLKCADGVHYLGLMKDGLGVDARATTPSLTFRTLTLGGGALPEAPTRAQVCGVKMHFQGIYYETREFGRFPGAFIELLADDDFAGALAQHKAVGDTHVTMNLTGAYREPGVVYPERLRNGHDWTNDLAGIKARIRAAVVAGLFVDFALGGDGRSVSADPAFGQYDDPVGWTYGFEWLMQNFSRVATAMRGDEGSACPDGEDLTRFMLFRPGYDGVFYGWRDPPGQPDHQPERVIAFGSLFRSVLPDGYLAIEHDIGHIPVGEGGGEYSRGMRSYDVILSEFPNWPETGDAVWQIAGRLLGPAYRRPADQPASDDPRPPFYLAPGTPRGPYIAVAFEFAKFPESRGRISPEDVDRAREYYRGLGYTYTG
jgi:hypothetical protein